MTIRLAVPAFVRFLVLAALLAPVSLPTSVARAEKAYSCEELREIGKDITVTGSLLQGEAIEGALEDGEVDQALRGMVEELDGLAKAEPDPELTAAVQILEKAWQDMDGDAYEAALARAKTAHGRIYERRCK